MSHLPPVWDGVLRRLGSELPEFALDAWIRPLRAREAEGHLLLLAPNEFHRERVRSRFLSTIAACALRESGGTVDTSIEVEAGGDGEASPLPDVAALEPRRAACRARPDGSRPAAARKANGVGSREPVQPFLDHTFETFVVGPSNALAREASLAVARGRQPGLSPLFLVGPAGTGKSHLARALVLEVRASGVARAVYASAESFTSRLMSSIRANETRSFKRRFREDCDLLVLEDVQFLEGKTSTQLELFHTIEHLRLVGRRIVLTGDRLPRDIPRFDARLSSELSRGLVAVMETPDAQLRREILRTKAARGAVRIPDDCLDLLVERVRGSVRDIEGVLIQLVATASLLGRPIDRALTEQALQKVAGPPPAAPVDARAVVEGVASFFGLSPQDLASRSRRRGVLVPRQIAMYLCHRYACASVAEIGRALGRDHPSVRNAIGKIERAMLERAPLRYQVEAIAARLEARTG